MSCGFEYLALEASQAAHHLEGRCVSQARTLASRMDLGKDDRLKKGAEEVLGNLLEKPESFSIRRWGPLNRVTMPDGVVLYQLSWFLPFSGGRYAVQLHFFIDKGKTSNG